MKNKKVLLNMAGKIIFILSGKVVRCLAAFDESRVAVFSLVVENGIIVEPLRLRFDMPFTDKSGIVAVGLQDGCQCGN